MSPSWIRVRVNSDGSKSFQVLYRRGGRGYRIESAGSFRGWPSGKKKTGTPAAALTKAQEDARTCRDLVAGWLARGLNPKDELRKLANADANVRNPERWRDDWLKSLHQLDEKSRRIYRYGIDAVLAILKPRDLLDITVADCERAVGELAGKYAAKTVVNYWSAFAQLLDYAGIDPNPARHRRVKLPKQRRTPPNVPTAAHLTAMLKRVADKYVLPMVFIEQTAVRVETIEALTWGAVDIAGCKVRVTEKGGKVRWVPVPRWLMKQLAATCPAEDRLTDRRVFGSVTGSGLRGAMQTAAKSAGIPHYHPHDLRHRRASLWHLQGTPDAVLAEWLGHERSSFTKDVYVHVMPVEELPVERLEAMVAEATR